MHVDREKPYIGVTGIDQVSEAEAIAQTFINEGLTQPDSTHTGMVGLLVSPGTLRHPTIGTVKHPALAAIRQIFEATNGKAFNTLHYSTYDESRLSQQLQTLLDPTGLYADQLCQGIQLNIAWPPPAEVEKTRGMFPDIKIILQLGPRVLSEKSAEDIAAGLLPYKELIDYALIDPSGGRGMIFETKTVTPIYNHIKDVYPDLPMVFAGGFNARNVRTRIWLISQLIGPRDFGDFGIDAEKGLRVQKWSQDTTDISIEKTTRYIRNAAIFFRAQPKQAPNPGN